MIESHTWARNGALFGGIGLMALILTSICAQAGDSHATCGNATMHGTYVYAYTGYIGTGGPRTRFAVAGLAVFNGDGTSHGVWTTTTEGQPLARLVTFRGKYRVNSDCSATETDIDQNGDVFHYDDFTGPGGEEISFVPTDPNVVSSGTETRTRTDSHH
jgi:hypothetical protein